ncbi:MAG: glycosyltransferase family 4 protein [Planctomycetaceae bacterium]
MRRVLVVSYFFPPAGNVGVQRTVRFVKRLREFGWEPVVLTAGDAVVDSLQPRFEDHVPHDVEVHRTPSFERFSSGCSVRDGKRRDGTNRNSFWKIARRCWKAFAVPDEKVGWVGHAVRRGVLVLDERPFDAIYVTGKPFSSFLIGERLSRRCGVPWVMDLRDLWTLNRRDSARNAWHRWRAPWMERRLVRSASAVVANTPGDRADFLAAFPECPREKFVTITNGFDADDFVDLPDDRFDRFTISYTGTFYGDRSSEHATHSPCYLFQALAALFRDRPELRNRIRVKIAGPKCDYARRVAETCGIADVVELLGVVPHRECLALLSRSHFQWLVCSRGEASTGWIPCKLYQYVAIRTPILGLLPEGDAADVVRRTRTGVVVPPDDVASIRRTVEEQFDSWNAGGTALANAESIEAEIRRYEGRALCESLADCFDRIATCERPEARTPEDETGSQGRTSSRRVGRCVPSGLEEVRR